MQPPLRLLVPVLVDRLVDDGEQRVGQPGVEARRGRRSRQLAERARHDVVLAEQQVENVEQRPAAGPEFLRHHDHRDHRHPRPARLVGEPVPEPFPLRLVRERAARRRLSNVAISPPLGRVRRRPVAVEDDQAVFRERRPRLVGTALDRIDVRPQRMRHPVIDDGRLLEPAPRAFFHDRVGLHEAAQAGDRCHLAVDQRDDAAFAHERVGVVGVIHQHPVEGGRKARLLRLRSFVDRGAPVVIGPRRRRHAVERVPHQRVVAKARQEFPVGSADGVAIESVGAGLGVLCSFIGTGSLLVIDPKIRTARTAPARAGARSFPSWCRRCRGRSGPS